jgi:hypothetical protein
VGAKRVIWHVGCERNLRRRGPRSFEVRSEVPLSEEPPRLDYLLLRKLTPQASRWTIAHRHCGTSGRSCLAFRSEGDDLLHSFGHGTFRSSEARWFWRELVGSKEAAMNMQDMEGYKELMD